MIPPPDPAPDTPAVAAANALTARVDALRVDLFGDGKEEHGGAIGFLTFYGRRNRRLIRAIILSLVVDAIVTALVGFAVVRADSAAHQATANAAALAAQQQSRAAACAQYNDSRTLVKAQVVGIEDTLLGILHDQAAALAAQRDNDIKLLGQAAYDQDVAQTQADIDKFTAAEATANQAFAPLTCTVQPAKP